MHRLWVLIVLVYLNNFIASAVHSSNIAQTFLKHKVVPDVLSVAPHEYLTVKFPSGAEVNGGNVLTPTLVKDLPSLSWNANPDPFYTVMHTGQGNMLTPREVQNPPMWVLWSYTATKYYTLMMIDPDRPTRQDPTNRSWLHWLVVNIPGSYIPNRGETLVEYVGAGPPRGTGLHRYVFLVYEQPGLMEFKGAPVSTNRTTANRMSFSAADFAKKFNLEDPIAGDFFQAQYDDYVPILQRQLKGDFTDQEHTASDAHRTFSLNLILFLSCIMFIFKATI